VLYQQPPTVLSFIKDYVIETKRQLRDDDYALFRQRIASIHTRSYRRNSFIRTPIAIIPGMIGHPKVTFARLSVSLPIPTSSSSTILSHSFQTLSVPTNFQCSQLTSSAPAATIDIPPFSSQRPTITPITHELIAVPIDRTDVSVDTSDTSTLSTSNNHHSTLLSTSSTHRSTSTDTNHSGVQQRRILTRSAVPAGQLHINAINANSTFTNNNNVHILNNVNISDNNVNIPDHIPNSNVHIPNINVNIPDHIPNTNVHIPNTNVNIHNNVNIPDIIAPFSIPHTPPWYQLVATTCKQLATSVTGHHTSPQHNYYATHHHNIPSTFYSSLMTTLCIFIVLLSSLSLIQSLTLL
jgi:hypothetical protein